jgi:hypothetical protein
MQKLLNDHLPWATILVGSIIVFVTVVGGVITIVQPSTLSFATYVNVLQKMVVGVGILGVGRGVAAAGKSS